MVYISLLIIHFVKICMSLAIGFLSLYPPVLFQEQPNWFGSYSNQSLIVVAQYFCRIPRINVDVSNKEVYDALNLPSATLLLGSLSEAGKCKAAMHKTRTTNVGDCFCLGYWLIWLIFAFGSMSLVSSVFYVSDFVATAQKKYTVTVLECDIRSKQTKFCAVRYLLMLVLVLVQIEYFSQSMRFTLPNSIYDRSYFETPLIWWLMMGFCALYAMIICPIELVVLSMHHPRNKKIHADPSPAVKQVAKGSSAVVEKPVEKGTIINMENDPKLFLTNSSLPLPRSVFGSDKEEGDVKSVISAHSRPPSPTSKIDLLKSAYEVEPISSEMAIYESKGFISNSDREIVIEIKPKMNEISTPNDAIIPPADVKF